VDPALERGGVASALLTYAEDWARARGIPVFHADGRSMIVQKSAFLASEEGVELSMHFQKKLGSGIFGGEGFIMQKLSGNGIAFIEIDGHAAEYDLSAGQ
ncbi:AIM24 family protein, partial [Intestinimonas massiliensis]|uniref:AIM24 family protein n=1 Tax=Intestinimonas massiliensis (ex Afouda et al. 2020) TaxID=1673721 RepID=UPI00210C8469